MENVKRLQKLQFNIVIHAQISEMNIQRGENKLISYGDFFMAKLIALLPVLPTDNFFFF